MCRRLIEVSLLRNLTGDHKHCIEEVNAERGLESDTTEIECLRLKTSQSRPEKIRVRRGGNNRKAGMFQRASQNVRRKGREEDLVKAAIKQYPRNAIAALTEDQSSKQT